MASGDRATGPDFDPVGTAITCPVTDAFGTAIGALARPSRPARRALSAFYRK